MGNQAAQTSPNTPPVPPQTRPQKNSGQKCCSSFSTLVLYLLVIGNKNLFKNEVEIKIENYFDFFYKKKNKYYTISFLAALLLCLINFWITVWYYELMQEQLGLSEIENNKSYNKYFSKVCMYYNFF